MTTTELDDFCQKIWDMNETELRLLWRCVYTLWAYKFERLMFPKKYSSSQLPDSINDILGDDQESGQ